ncbi:MAG: trimethylamine methyltransferase family protein [Desulfobacterales bacterium]|nr:trimethylamine methyltransferase family protein [Desulfobacterales bacterium]
MDILEKTGVAFMYEEALEIFKSHGFRVEGNTVYFTEEDVRKSLSTTPSQFVVEGRNPEKSVSIGEDDWVFLPTYGAPYICEKDGSQRPGTLADYESICKLVQTSPYIDMNAFKLVEPSDVPTETAYLDMLQANMLMCDKPFMGSTDTIEACRDTMEMLSILFGGRETLKEKVVCLGLVNVLSPLKYGEEMAGAIVEYARNGQAMAIINMIMGGTSGPVSLPGLVTLMNAEILAGVVLSQLVNPGTPVVYGTTSCPTNMQSGAATIGAPETYIINAWTTQIARYYNLPCRTGGSITDSLIPDAQSMAEGALCLSTTVRNGANFILHSCGMIGTYIGCNMEKWIIDEEMCGMVRSMMRTVPVTEESIGVEAIQRVGIGGNYLMDPDTLKHCRTAFYKTSFYNKSDASAWMKSGGLSLADAASVELEKRFAAYERPAIDPEVEKALIAYIEGRKASFKAA